MKITIGKCKTCGTQKNLGLMQPDWCPKCNPELDPTCPRVKLIIKQ